MRLRLGKQYQAAPTARDEIMFEFEKLIDRLQSVPGNTVTTDYPLAPLTSYRIGGPARIFVAPETEAAVGAALEVVNDFAAPIFVLGRGSNVLVSDQGWDGVLLYLGENLSGWMFRDGRADVLAGSRLSPLIREAVGRGLGGMELMAGIPGGVGGALRMNAGAFGQEIEQTTERVRGFRHDGTPVSRDRGAIQFGYRHATGLEDMVITGAVFGFQPGDAATLQKRLEDTLSLRKDRQPLDQPSCGSVFKRPPGYFAGALIEEAGLKGERVGGAMISPKHCGFILNTGNATATDVLRLIRMIEERVMDRFGVRLEREVQLVGPFEE
jgi:UDP-N-acetylmuramate dehydrogenase